MMRTVLTLLWFSLLQLPLAAAPLFPSQPQLERLAVLDTFWAGWKQTYLRTGCGGAYVDTSGDEKPTWGRQRNGHAHRFRSAWVWYAARARQDGSSGPCGAGTIRGHGFVLQRAPGGLWRWVDGVEPDARLPRCRRVVAKCLQPTAISIRLWRSIWRTENGVAITKLSIGHKQPFWSVTSRKTGMMRLGDWAVEGGYAHASRSSDFMPASFAAFAEAAGDRSASWTAIRDRGYRVWGRISEGLCRRYRARP